MSSTASPEPEGGEDQAYFRAIEEAFLALRGKTILLGAEDWQIAREWRRLGVPIELVVSVMEALFARQRERRSKRGISSLRYFRAAVEAAWDERLALGAGGGRALADPGPPIRTRLDSLARALPGDLPGAAALSAEIRALEGDPIAVEERLEELDRLWIARLADSLDAEATRELDQRVDHALARVAHAAPETERQRLRERLRAQSVRSRFHWPLLSLFAPEALSGNGSPADAS
ncbi:MAG TPA: hypothetical protein VI942_08360 [Thermoanaerobaculia bacterium]|nr:hypothetical protein [Thermoanaerobaculia bacterium]